MAGIPDASVADVRAASDLADVVSERLKLKKQGRRFVGLCPFHNEKTPSFSVDPSEGLYYCFGCRRGGDVFKFVQEVEGVGFVDAVRLLADRAGIVLPESGGSAETDRKGTLHAALRFAARFYFDQLRTDAGARARAYLADREFTKEAVLAFGIGVAPDAWDALTVAATAEGFKPDVLEAVGLSKARERGEGHYDVFRDRLMFPILSPIGKVLGFGGRILPGSAQGSADYTPAKYINTPETEVYHKSRVLYGMKQAKRAIRSEEEAIVVEGYADVVALWQAGVQNVVAASGTALTATQMDQLAKLDVKRVVLLFDADAAGQGAARKAIDVTLDAGLAPYAVTLPDGADPDSFVRLHGAEAFRRRLREERRDFVDFLVERARQSGALSTPEEKADVVQDLVTTLRRVGKPVLEDEYLKKAQDGLQVNYSDLRRMYERGGGRRTEPRSSVPERDDLPPPPAAPLLRPEETVLLRLMLRLGAPMVEHVMTRMGIEEFTPGAPRRVAEALVAQYEAGAIESDPFIQGAHGEEIRGLVANVLSERHALSDNWAQRIGVSVPDLDAKPFESSASAMRLLKLDRVLEAVDAATRRVFEAERDGEDAAPIQEEIMQLNTLRQQIETGAFMTWGE